MKTQETYLRIVDCKTKSFCYNQSITCTQTGLEKASQKVLINSSASKAIATGEKPIPDQNGQVNGQL